LAIAGATPMSAMSPRCNRGPLGQTMISRFERCPLQVANGSWQDWPHSTVRTVHVACWTTGALPRIDITFRARPIGGGGQEVATSTTLIAIIGLAIPPRSLEQGSLLLRLVSESRLTQIWDNHSNARKAVSRSIAYNSLVISLKTCR
jgi:hypothetical protein